MNDKERIKLAEAMGWKRGRTDTVAVMGKPIAHTRWIDPQGIDRAQCPDPFTDANDDYAVLEWLRAEPDRHSDAMMLLGTAMRRYKIGDYARAALKVIE